MPPDAVAGPTPTPTPVPEGEATPASAEVQPTATPFPQVLLVALTPQQQLFLKYAVESGSEIDYALRNSQDNQLYAVENVDLNYLIEQFNIEIPPNFDYTVDIFTEETDVTATPESSSGPSDTGEDS